MIYPAGSTSVSVDVQIVDDTGLAVTGLVAATFPTLTYSLGGANADVAFPALSDLATITTAYASGGVKERGNGVYRLDLPNGVFTTAGIVKVRGEASGKHVLMPWINVGPLDAIKAKTDNLPSDPADQSLIIAATDALATLIGDVPTNAELVAALGTADDAVLAQVVLVKAKTDNLPVSPAATGDIPSAAAVASQVRTELTAELAKIGGMTFTVAGFLDVNIQRVNDVAVQGTGAVGDEWGPA